MIVDDHVWEYYSTDRHGHKWFRCKNCNWMSNEIGTLWWHWGLEKMIPKGAMSCKEIMMREAIL